MAWTEKLPSGKHRGLYRTPDGKKKSAGAFTHETAALREARLAEDDAKNPRRRSERALTLTWGDWVEEWWDTRDVEDSTLRREGTQLEKHIRPYWATTPLASITRGDVRAWAMRLVREKGLSRASARRIANIFSASLTGALDAELLDVNPVHRLKLSVPDSDGARFLSQADAGKLIEQFDGEQRAIVSAALGCGLRWGELNGLQVERVDFGRSLLRVVDTFDSTIRALKPYPKSRHIRTVPIPTWVLERLEGAVEGRSSGYVFRGNGSKLDYANWRKKHWLPGTQLAGLAPLRFHDLRHSYASYLIAAGYSLAEIAVLLGHEDPSTTQIYAHLLPTVDAERLHRALPPIG